jgi:hypothetical protein
MDSTILNQTQRIREKELRNVSFLGYCWLFILGTGATVNRPEPLARALE